MAIRLIEGEDGGFYPQVFCDGCGGRIADTTDALVAWPLPRGRTEVIEFAFLHRKDCDNGYRASVDAPTMWLGLDEFVASLKDSFTR